MTEKVEVDTDLGTSFTFFYSTRVTTHSKATFHIILMHASIPMAG